MCPRLSPRWRWCTTNKERQQRARIAPSADPQTQWTCEGCSPPATCTVSTPGATTSRSPPAWACPSSTPVLLAPVLHQSYLSQFYTSPTCHSSTPVLLVTVSTPVLLVTVSTPVLLVTISTPVLLVTVSTPVFTCHNSHTSLAAANLVANFQPRKREANAISCHCHSKAAT